MNVIQLLTEQLNHDVKYLAKQLADYRDEFANSSLISLDYIIKWSAEDIVVKSTQYKELSKLGKMIKNNIVEESLLPNKLIEVLKDEVSYFDRSLRMLSINNSTGMYHNADAFFNLKGFVEVTKTYERYIKILEGDKKSS